jgi:hypothetical protein
MLLHQAIFEGVVTDDTHASARREQGGATAEETLKGIHFTIHGDTQSLENLWENSLGTPPKRVMCRTNDIEGGPHHTILEDLRETPRPTDFPEITERPQKIVNGDTPQPFRSGLPLRAVETEIQRDILPECESPLRIINVWRTQTQISEHDIYVGETQGSDVTKIRMHERHGVSPRSETLTGEGKIRLVRIETDESPLPSDAFEECRRMSPQSNRHI